MKTKTIFSTVLFVILLIPAGTGFSNGITPLDMHAMTQIKSSEPLETATLGAGCFWCVEAVFQDLKGVHSVISGYSGGHVPNPTYREVTSGRTGHAEVCQIVFDPSVIPYEDLLEIYWETHDPTTLNRQGADVGTQYRSVIFYHGPEQKRTAESLKKKLTAEGRFENPIVTEITAFEAFYEAEDYHQDYYSQNPNQPYCRVVISPKLKKFREKYKDALKQ
jgi:peptide-methionine (S)-S-oxide reductase